MNKTTKILLTLGAVVLVVGLAVGLSSNRQPSEDRQGSVRNIIDENPSGVRSGDALGKWELITLGGGVQTGSFQNPDKATYVDDVFIVIRHDPNSATTTNDAIVEPSSAFYIDVGTSTVASGFDIRTGVHRADGSGGFYASGTPDKAPYGSIVDRFYLASTTGNGVNSALSADYGQIYAELVGSTTVKTLGFTFRGDESDLIGLPVTVATSTHVSALLYEAGGSYGEHQRTCTPGADTPGYGCQAATSTVIGFLADIWIHVISK